MYCRREKEMRKILETPEEKRARRLKKKEDKERKLRAEMGWDQDMMVRGCGLIIIIECRQCCDIIIGLY